MNEKYNQFREDFLDIAEPFMRSDILDQLKCKYSYQIDSKRKLSRIDDLRTLIKLLEKRDVISYNNIEQLRYISKTFVGETNLESKLIDYENWLHTVPELDSYNQYQSDNTVSVLSPKQGNVTKKAVSVYDLPQSSSDNQIASTSQESHYYSEISEQKKEKSNRNDKRIALQQKVLQHISERLGRSWRDVGRHLGIKECEIDNIQCKYPYNLKEQSYEILKMYISQSDAEQWALNLIRALEKGRRRDLKEIVEELILSTNC